MFPDRKGMERTGGGSPNPQRCSFVIIVAENNDSPLQQIKLCLSHAGLCSFGMCFLFKIRMGEHEMCLFLAMKSVSPALGLHLGEMAVMNGNERKR